MCLLPTTLPISPSRKTRYIFLIFAGSKKKSRDLCSKYLSAPKTSITITLYLGNILQLASISVIIKTVAYHVQLRLMRHSEAIFPHIFTMSYCQEILSMYILRQTQYISICANGDITIPLTISLQDINPSANMNDNVDLFRTINHHQLLLTFTR